MVNQRLTHQRLTHFLKFFEIICNQIILVILFIIIIVNNNKNIFGNVPYCSKVLQFGLSLGGILTFQKIVYLHFLFLLLSSKLTGYLVIGLPVNIIGKYLKFVTLY